MLNGDQLGGYRILVCENIYLLYKEMFGKLFNNISDKIDKVLNNAISPVYKFLWLLLGILYFATFLGVWFANIAYVKYVSSIFQTFIALVLIIRFNPLRNEIQLQHYDRDIIFASGTFILLNAGLTASILHNVENKTLNTITDTSTFLGNNMYTIESM
jgi:hypothetical protein